MPICGLKTYLDRQSDKTRKYLINLLRYHDYGRHVRHANCKMLNAKCLLQINFEAGSMMHIECILLFYNTRVLSLLNAKCQMPNA